MNTVTNIIYNFYFSFFLTSLILPLAIKIGHACHIMDNPNSRKVHKMPIPRTGGLAIGLGAIIPLILTTQFSPIISGYFLGGTLIILSGLIDDIISLNYKQKLVCQVVSALSFIFVSKFQITTLGELIPNIEIHLSFLSIPITIIFFLAVMNIINLSDGLDGLAGGLSTLILISIAALAYFQKENTALLIITVIIGALMAFLRYNIHPATIFMGDTGSQFLGYTIAVLLIIVTQNHSIYSPTLPLFILGTPIIDTLLVIIERISKKLNPFLPDKSHIHHKLIKNGFSHENAVIIIYFLHLILILCGWNLRFQSDFMILAVYLSLIFLIITLVQITKKYLKVIKDTKENIFEFFQKVIDIKKYRYFRLSVSKIS